MSNLASDIEKFDEVLKSGVETRKYVGRNWKGVVNHLSKSTGKRVVQLSNGQLCEVINGTATAAGETSTSSYALVSLNAAEAEIAAGESVITASGEVATLSETTTGIVISGTSDVAAAGELGSYTAAEAGFLGVPKAVVVCAVAALTGFAIGDAIAGKIAAELDDEDFNWGEDTITGTLIGKLQAGILMKVEVGGNTSFDEDLIERLYQALVKKDFYAEGDYPFSPADLESGKKYVFSDFVDIKQIGKAQLALAEKAIKIDEFLEQNKADYPGVIQRTGWNQQVKLALETFFIEADKRVKFSGVSSVTFSIWMGIAEPTFGTTQRPFIDFSVNVRNSNITEGTYREIPNSDFPTHPTKRIFFTPTTDKPYLASNTFLEGDVFYGEITYYEGQGWYNDYKIVKSDINETSGEHWITGSYNNIPSPTLTETNLWRNVYTSESWNIGKIREEYQKRKLPDAKIPDLHKTLAENYPEWNSKTSETSTPTEENKNKKRKYKYAGNILNSELDPANNSNNSQKDTQEGKNKNNNLINHFPIADKIIDNVVKPDNPPGDNKKPKPEGENKVPFVPANPVSNTGFVSIYSPTTSQLRRFSSWLWSSDFFDNVKKLFQDPMSAIIGLHMIYTTPTIGSNANIIVGFIDSEISSRTVSNQYKTINCGTIKVNEYYKDSRDYDFTKISIFLPFVGIKELNPKDVMGGSLNVTCTVDVLTGTMLYNLNISKNGKKQTLYMFSGNCAVQLPISAGSYSSILANTIGVAASGAATIATGGAAAPLLIGSAAKLATGSQLGVTASNNIGSNAGAMGTKVPYLIINRMNSYNANYDNIQGIPSNMTVTIGNCSGYTKIKDCHLENIPATNEEINEIYELLKGGVIL